MGGHHTRIKCRELTRAPPFQVCLLLKPDSHPTSENTGATSSLSVFLVTRRKREREERRGEEREKKGKRKGRRKGRGKGNEGENKGS